MKVTYDKEIDSKYVKIGTVRTVAKTKKLEDWLLVDHDARGNIIGVEILWASKHPISFSISNNGNFLYFPLPAQTITKTHKNSSESPFSPNEPTDELSLFMKTTREVAYAGV